MSCLRSGRGGKVSFFAKDKFDIAPTGGDSASFPFSDMVRVPKVHTLDIGGQRSVWDLDTR